MDLHRVTKPVLTFDQVMKTFVSNLPGTKTFCHKSLQVPDAKNCSYLRTDKNQTKQK